MAEPYYTLYFNWIEDTQELNDQEKGRLIDAIVLYARGDDWQDRIKGNENKVRDLVMKYSVKRERKKSSCQVKHSNQIGRGSQKAIAWRNSVFERDNYTCCICLKIGGKLNAHHLYSWANYPDKRYDINNGVTLCQECHKELHKRAQQRRR